MIVSKKKKSQTCSLVNSKYSTLAFCDQQITAQNKISQMQKKMVKIMNAYKDLKKQCKQKDEIIEQLTKQNMQLKVKISQHTCQNFYQKQQKINSYSTLKTKDFNLSNRSNNFYNENINLQTRKLIKNQEKQYSTIREPKSLSPKIHFRMNGRSQVNNEEFFKSKEKAFDQQKQLKSNNLQKIVTKPELSFNFNKINNQTQEDLQFFQTLQKLKQKIIKYQKQEDQNKNHNKNEPESKSLKQVKSVQNLNKTNSKLNSQVLNFKIDSNQNKNDQMQKLKQIWNERDKEIKKMDDLFANIDKRLNAQRG